MARLTYDFVQDLKEYLLQAERRGQMWQYEHLTAPGLHEAIELCYGFTVWLQRTIPPDIPEGSQDEEDRMIAELLDGDYSGTYIDIGAGEAVSCSNTWQLYRHDMRGLLIEPLKDNVYNLLLRRPGDAVYPAAASDGNGWAIMYLLRSLSSLRADWNIEEQARAFVWRERTAEILARYPEIRDACSVMSIDVEGHEEAVLNGIDWDGHVPRIMIVEDSRPDGSPTHHVWEGLLTMHGYELHAKTKTNRIYVNDPDDT